MTYPQKEVTSFLNENFECVQINQNSASDAEKQFMLAHRLLWSPGLVFLDYRGHLIRTSIGFRLPSELIAESSMALGKISLLHLKPVDANNWFQYAHQVASEYEAAAESLYWSAIALMRTPDGNVDSLWAVWEQLREQYPKSKWATSADCRDYPPVPPK